MHMTRVINWIAIVFGACSAQAFQPKAVQPIELSPAPQRSTAVMLTITNKAGKPMFFLRPDRPWHWAGWDLTIAGPDGDFAFYPPPPSPWVAGTESFILLHPGESFRTPIDLAEAKSRNDPKKTLASTKGAYRIAVAYIFDGEEMKQSPGSPLASVFATLTGGNFRPHDYVFLPRSRSNTVEITIR